MNRLKIAVRYSVACLFIVASSTSSRAAIRTVALSGQAVPGISGNLTFQSFNEVDLNDRGETAFVGVITGPGVDFSNNVGLWTSSNGGLQFQVRSGATITPTSGALGTIRIFHINDSGQVVLGVKTSLGDAIWAQRHGTMEVVADSTKSVAISPTTILTIPSSTPDTLYFPVLNNQGQIAFRSYVGGNNISVWLSHDDNTLQPITYSSPLSPQPNNIGLMWGATPRLNDRGQLAFASVLNNRNGITKTDENMNFLTSARDGEPAVGGGLYQNLIVSPSINNSGNLAFWGFANEASIWSEGRSGQVELVARRTSPAPGVEIGTVFEDVGMPILDGDGRVAFPAQLRDTTKPNNLGRSGIWKQNADFSLELVAVDGQQAPGTAPAEAFRSLNIVAAPVINAQNQVAFSGVVGPPGPGSKAGIWAQDIHGALKLIAMAGSTIDVDNGPSVDLRTIRNLDFLGGAGTQDGRAAGFNDLGQLAFTAYFTDGSSGVFVSDLVQIPEPTTAMLVALALAGCAGGWHTQRRRGRGGLENSRFHFRS